MRAIVTDEQRRSRAKVALPEGPGRFRSGDRVSPRSHSPAMLPRRSLSALQNRPGQIGDYLHRGQ